MFRPLIAAVIGSALSASGTVAQTQAQLQPQMQANGTVQAPEQPRCEDAAVRLNGTALPRAGAVQWNDWVTLTGCGSRGAAIIAGTITSDAVRRESELTRLDQFAGLLDGWFQPQLVTAYEFVLRAPDASAAMKLRAMWLLAGLYAPRVDVAGPLQGFMSARCEAYERSTILREAPERLPEVAYHAARAAINAAADDRISPEFVRSTARCWDGVLRDEFAHSAVVEDDAPTAMLTSHAAAMLNGPVRVVYDCDGRFVFYNDAGYDLAVRYSGHGSGVLRVTRGGPFIWTTGRFGPVRFWMGDTEIFYEQVAYRPCYSPGRRVIVSGYVVPRVVRPIIVNPGRPRAAEPGRPRAAEPRRTQPHRTPESRREAPRNRPETPRTAVPKRGDEQPRRKG